LANFVIIEFFPTLNKSFGLAWVMLLFAALTASAVLFIARYLPETKGLALGDVVAGFERQAVGAKASA